MLSKFVWEDTIDNKFTKINVFLAVIITPITILIDLICLPVELITYFVYKYFERKKRR